jgi:hypothetical protein
VERDGLNVVRLARTWLYSLSTNAGLLFGFVIYAGVRADAFRLSLFGLTFSGSAVLAVLPSGRSQTLQRDGFCGRQTSYGALNMPN